MRAKVALTIRVSEELFEKLRKKRFAEGASLQEVGEECLLTWVNSQADKELTAFKKFRKLAPKRLFDAVLLIFDVVNNRSNGL